MPTSLVNNRWQPAPDEIAARFSRAEIEAGDLRNLVLEPGQQVVFQVADRFVFPAELENESGAGLESTVRKVMQRFGRGGRKLEQAYLFCASFDVPIQIAPAFSKEPLEVNAGGHLVLNVTEPDIAALTLFRGQQRITIADVHRLLDDDIATHAQAWLIKQPVDVLLQQQDAAARLESELMNALADLLFHMGLQLAALRVRYDIPILAEVSRARADANAQRIRWQVTSEAERAQLVERTWELHREDLLASLMRRLRQAALSDAFDNLTTTEARADLLLEQDVHKQLGEGELHDRLWQSLAWEEADDFEQRAKAIEVGNYHDRLVNMSRVFLLAQIETELRRLRHESAASLELEETKQRILIRTLEDTYGRLRRRAEAAEARERRRLDELANLEVQGALDSQQAHTREIKIRLNELEQLSQNRVMLDRELKRLQVRERDLKLQARARDQGLDLSPAILSSIRTPPQYRPVSSPGTGEWACRKCLTTLTEGARLCPTCKCQVLWESA